MAREDRLTLNGGSMDRHPFDAVSFVAGAIFLGLGLASLVGADVDPGALRWLFPIVFILLGLALLLPLARRAPGGKD